MGVTHSLSGNVGYRSMWCVHRSNKEGEHSENLSWEFFDWNEKSCKELTLARFESATEGVDVVVSS